MSLNRSHLSCAILATVVTLGIALGIAPDLGFAADAAPAPDTTPQTAAPPASTPKLLSFTEIEGQLAAQGIRVKEMEVRDKVLEVEGYDAQGRKIELLVDRRSGEILSRKLDK